MENINNTAPTTFLSINKMIENLDTEAKEKLIKDFVDKINEKLAKQKDNK